MVEEEDHLAEKEGERYEAVPLTSWKVIPKEQSAQREVLYDRATPLISRRFMVPERPPKCRWRTTEQGIRDNGIVLCGFQVKYFDLEMATRALQDSVLFWLATIGLGYFHSLHLAPSHLANRLLFSHTALNREPKYVTNKQTPQTFPQSKQTRGYSEFRITISVGLAIYLKQRAITGQQIGCFDLFWQYFNG